MQKSFVLYGEYAELLMLAVSIQEAQLLLGDRATRKLAEDC